MKVVTKKIRVLQSVGSLGMGGNEIFVMNFYRHINKEKFQVDFVIYDDSKMHFYDEIISMGGKVHICKSKIKNKYLSALIQILKVKNIIIKNNYDIIHCHSCSFIGIFRGAIAGKLASNVKIISHSHNPGMPKNTAMDTFIRDRFKKYLSNIVNLGFACSMNAAESKYTDKFMKSKKFEIINNAIDINKFLFNIDIRKQMREEYEIRDELVIGNIGRLEEQKNQKFLLDVFAEIKKRDIPSKLIIIGEGSLRDYLEKYAIEKQIQNDVIFVGQVSESSNYYNMMDVFVMTSIYEGFPFVMVEAQVNGLPSVISSNITRSVNISENVKFISLEESCEKWVDSILGSSRKFYDFNCEKNTFQDYDLEYQTNQLEKRYISLARNVR